MCLYCEYSYAIHLRSNIVRFLLKKFNLILFSPGFNFPAVGDCASPGQTQYNGGEGTTCKVDFSTFSFMHQR